MEPITQRPPRSPDPVVMRMHWRRLAALHWRVDPGRVQRRLPDGLTVDVHDGAAWIGLIPFDMRDVRPPGVPAVLPWIGDFPETNVRTYVVGPRGRRGVYFHSLEAARLGAVAAARTAYDLPYFWADMRIATAPRRIRYTSTRRWPGPRGAGTDIELAVGGRIDDDAQGDLDVFLSARWTLYAPRGDRLVRATVAHEVWPLHTATVVSLHDGLVGAAGYPDLAGRAPDHVRFSPGVSVDVGLPETLPV